MYSINNFCNLAIDNCRIINNSNKLLYIRKGQLCRKEVVGINSKIIVMKKSLVYLAVIVMSVTTAYAPKGPAAFFKTGYLYAPRSAKGFQQIDRLNISSVTNSDMIIGLEAYYRTGQAIISWAGYSAQQA